MGVEPAASMGACVIDYAYPVPYARWFEACAVEYAYPVPYAQWFGACAVEQLSMLVLDQMDHSL